MTEHRTIRTDFEEETGYEWRPWRWASRGLGILVIVLIVGALIGAAVWGIGVATSDVAGRGEAVIQKNSATNRIQAQAQFEASFAHVKQFTQQYRDANAAVAAFTAAHPDVGNGTAFDPLAEQLVNLQRTATGIRQQCLNVVARYEADARTYTAEDFRAVDLPHTFTQSDPAFSGGTFIYSDYNCEATS